jgi:peptide/nickel transport system permease protein
VYKYLVRRVLQSIPVLFIISIVLFTIIQLQPVHPWDQLLYNPRITPQDRQRILDYYGFSQPAYIQYLVQVKNWLHFDLGSSYFSHQSTLSLIRERLPNTVILMGTAYLLTLIVSIPIGVIAAVKQYSRFDTFVTTGAFIGFSLPNFWFGLMLIIALAVWPYEHLGFKIFPTGGMSSELGATGFQLLWTRPLDLGWHLVLPALVLAVQFVAQYSRFIRSAMLDVLNQDFIRTARAKGLTEGRVVVRHALRNALLPLITLMGLDIPQLFVGAIITEQVFAWPGMGRLIVESIFARDYPLVQGGILVFACTFALINLIADLSCAALDPRIRYG